MQLLGRQMLVSNFCRCAFHSTSAGMSPVLVYKATAHSRRISRISTQMQRFHPTINLNDTLTLHSWLTNLLLDHFTKGCVHFGELLVTAG